MTKLFISYRSLDSAKVDALVARLRSLKNPDNTPRYAIWQDKTSIPVGQDWWKAIVQGIIDCDLFVFMISHQSAQNVNCRAELSYARKRNRPIIPLVLEGEFAYNPVTGKNDIAYWEHIPSELNDGRFQFLFYEGVAFVEQLNQAADRLSRLGLCDIPADEPPDPRDANDAGNDTSLVYDQACDLAWKSEFTAAERLFQRLLDWRDPLFADDAHEWIKLLREYEKLARLDARESVRYKIPALWQEYAKQFPKPFTPLFDPRDLKSRYSGVTVVVPTPPSPTVGAQHVAPLQTPTEAALERARAFKGRRNSDWQSYVTTFSYLKIPDMPFCLVPVGSFDMGSDDGYYDDETPVHQQTIKQPYWIGQYPVTNAQWALAVSAGAVQEPLKAGDSLKWYKDQKMADAPVVGVTWFMARDFVNWLGARLPTEMEWEYAARGVESLRYPWGNDWNPKVPVWSENSGGKPADVTSKPEGKSWVDARHMIGNVWEWCASLNEPYPYLADGTQERDTGDSTDVRRVLRGGSCRDSNTNDLRAACRGRGNPSGGSNDWGFRLALSY